MHIGFFTGFISKFLGVPVSTMKDDEEYFLRFESENCLLPGIQQEFTAEAMKLFFHSIHKPCFYELRSILEINVLIFPYDGEIVLVGPYVEKEWDEKNASAVLAQQGVPITQLMQYQYYYSAYRICMHSTVMRICIAAIHAASPGAELYEHQPISPLKKKTAVNEVKELLSFESISARYATENEFLMHVKAGRPEEALEVYERLFHNRNSYIFSHHDIRYAIAAISSLRTLLRKAAEEAGVSPSVLDYLSGMYAQKSLSFQTRDQMQRENLSTEMIYGYTKAVNEVLRENYSSPIRKAADYIKMNLGSSLMLTEIAVVAGLAPNYLSHAFKADTGFTVTQYIAKKRCEIAAKLLLTTDLAVHDISIYVGYDDSNYFTKVFKNHYDLTPTKFRQERKR